MGFLDLFRQKAKRQSADIAKERLQIIVAHQRAERSDNENGVLASPEILSKLQHEIMDVIAKYVKVDREKVNVDVGNINGNSVLELNVTLQES
ncbi:cell division topological specificity factor MinE [Thiotrichales bacterium 19S11-10]|nr:cell division topological specificity factor MinE [Thiotrichales bacterium 19S11-10]MCF6807520.1 cell division topological specificity factor MinE [Thiotrichales bacterium 19S9-11]MCF6811489.1 cell division topological specificity factor MinE [Thiotrichales bacterium 19S9-12]